MVKNSLRKNYFFNNDSGFTLIELLVIAAIISLMSTLMLANYRAGEKQFALQSSAHKLAQDIRRTQEMAMSAKEYQGSIPAGGYGVYLKAALPDDRKHYLLFVDDNNNQSYNPGIDRIVEDISFIKGVKIASLSPSPLTIIFTPPDPIITIQPAAAIGAVTLTNDGQSKTIRTNEVGLITIE